MRIPNPVSKAIQPYLKQEYELLNFNGRNGHYSVILARVERDGSRRKSEHIHLRVHKSIATETKRSGRTYQILENGELETLDQWELTGQALREFLHPTGSKIKHVPRSIPFYGTLDEALLKCAQERLGEFLALAPSFPGKADAALYLEVATAVTEARGKLVRSIHWQEATSQTRRDIWNQLLMMESQIAYNLLKFGEWWDTFHEHFEQCPVVYPLPEYVKNNGYLKSQYQNTQVQEVGDAIRNLAQIAEAMSENLRIYRGEQPQEQPCLSAVDVEDTEAIIEADIILNPEENEILQAAEQGSSQTAPEAVQLALF